MKNNSLDLYLSLIAYLIDAACDISNKMSLDGFLLLKEEFGGLAGDGISSEEAGIELEIMKARFARQPVPDGSGVVIRGYTSEHVIPILTSHGLTLDTLEDLSRSKDVDRVFENQPLLWRYTKINLERRRSAEFSFSVAAQKKAEARSLVRNSAYSQENGIESAKKIDIFSSIIEPISLIIDKFGFVIKRSKLSKRSAAYFLDCSKIGPFQFSFIIEINNFSILPLRLDCYIMPVDKFIYDKNGVAISQKDAARPLWSMIPNFGMYRVAMTCHEIDLLKLAYEKLFSYLIPWILGSRIYE